MSGLQPYGNRAESEREVGGLHVDVHNVLVKAEVRSQTSADIVFERTLVQFLQVRRRENQKRRWNRPRNMRRASNHRMTFCANSKIN